MNKLKRILALMLDSELWSKPNSTRIRTQIIKDITSVDPKKWFHPKLPDGKTCPYWGTTETVEGKKIFKEGDVELHIWEHPNLEYRIMDLPLATYKEGEFHNLTRKDLRRIRDSFYKKEIASNLT